MKIAILGFGAREHALGIALKKKGSHFIYFLPGNAGTAQIGFNVAIDLGDVPSIVEFARLRQLDLVVVGPEGLLAKGVVDQLSLAGIPAFGPTQAAMQIEGSKSSALDLMGKSHIPHPRSWVFSNPQAVRTFVRKYNKPVVVKADGLAKGKGVWICQTDEEAFQAAMLCTEYYPGLIVVQELCFGPELSVFAFTDGFSISPLVAACDYKRLCDGDKGLNTGGMGSYTWPAFWNEQLEKEVLEWVMRPAIRAMARLGTPFSGMLFAGLMLTEQGLRVLEFNARPGDPESQVIFPLFKGDLAKVMLSCARGNLSPDMVEWDMTKHAVGVVVASPNYPELSVDYFHEVPGLLGDEGVDTFICHGNTRLTPDGKRVLVGAGRILTIVGIGGSVSEARAKVYSRLGEEIKFPHRARGDIAQI